VCFDIRFFALKQKNINNFEDLSLKALKTNKSDKRKEQQRKEEDNKLFFNK